MKMSQYDYEKWLIKNLPDSWVSRPKQSEGLEKLKTRHREAHENCVKDMSEELALINTELETDIRLKSEYLKVKLEALKDEGENFLPTLPRQEEILDFDYTVFKRGRIYYVELLQKGKFLINEFYIFLKDLEADRSNKIKQVFNLYYKRFRQVMHLPPYEIQVYFENQILQMNQTILSNLKNYASLNYQLTLRYDQEIKFFLYKIHLTREEWIRLYKENYFELLRNFKISLDDLESVINETYSTKDVVTIFEAKKKELWDKILASVPFINEGLQQWYDCLEIVFKELRDAGYDLINIYKTAVDDIANKMCDEFKTKSYILTGFGPPDEILSFRNDILEPEINYIRDSAITDISGFETRWNNMLEQGFLNLNYINGFIKEYGKILCQHKYRIDELQVLTKRDLSQTMQKNDTLIKGQEIGLNVAIDTLRQEGTAKKADKSLKKVQKSLNSMKNSIIKMHGNEMEVINKYYNFIESESNILKAELNQFLLKHSQKNQMPALTENESELITNELSLNTFKYKVLTSETAEIGRNDEELEDDMEATAPEMDGKINVSSGTLQQQLSKCQVSVLMDNCVTVLMGAIEEYLETFEETHKIDAKIWAEPQVKLLEERFRILSNEYENRYERIKTDIYDPRMFEIKLHLDRFNSHKAGIDEAIKKMEEEMKLFKVKQKENVHLTFQEFNELCQNILSDIPAAIFAAEAIMRMEHFLEKRKGNIIKQNQTYREEILNTIIELTQCNKDFLCSIKLFSECGNFNVKEAQTIAKKLYGIDSKMKKKTKTLMKALNGIEKHVKDMFVKSPKKLFILLNNHAETIKFKETTQIQILNLQNDIKHEALEMKIKRKRVEIKLEEMKKVAEDKDDYDKDRLKNITNLLPSIILYLEEFGNYLRETENPPTILLPVEDELASTKTTTSRKSEKHKKPVKAAPRVNTDYCIKFFENYIEYPDLIQFMPIIRKMLLTTLQEIQDSAKGFFLQKLDPTDNYDDYMKDIVYKFKNYYMQCGKVWIEEIQAYKLLVYLLNKFLKDICFHQLSRLHKMKIYCLKKYHELNSMAQLKSVIQSHKTELKNLHFQLKAMKGFPKNEKALENLKSEFKQAYEDAVTLFEEKFEQILDEPEAFEDNYKNELHDIKCDIKALENAAILYDLSELLTKQAEEFIEGFTLQNVQSEVINDYINNLILLLQKNPNTEDQVLSNIAIAGSCDIEFEMLLPFSIEYQQSILEQIDLQTFLKDYKKRIQINFADMSKLKRIFEEFISSIYFLWEADLDKILKIYNPEVKPICY